MKIKLEIETTETAPTRAVLTIIDMVTEEIAADGKLEGEFNYKGQGSQQSCKYSLVTSQ